MARPLRQRRAPLWFALSAALAGAVAPSGSAAAQSCEQTGTSSCTVNVTLRAPIPFTAALSASSSVTDLGVLTATTLVPGQSTGTRTDAGPTVQAQANFAWMLTMRAGSTTWSYSGSATAPSKSAADLSWRAGSGSFTPISTTGSTLLSGTAGAAATAVLSFRTTWSWTSNPPGSYALPLTLTLTAP